MLALLLATMLCATDAFESTLGVIACVEVTPSPSPKPTPHPWGLFVTCKTARDCNVMRCDRRQMQRTERQETARAMHLRAEVGDQDEQQQAQGEGGQPWRPLTQPPVIQPGFAGAGRPVSNRQNL